MRFTEFNLLEANETKFYTIGDSHAVAVAQAGGADWVNLAIGGRSSTDSAMLANISKVPKGVTVLVSQGANDTANAARAHIDSQGKRPLRKPQEIARNVANVVELVEAQGAKVIFLLFPNGPGRGAGLAKYYGGDYQEEVRSAIKAAIGVPIIDINGQPLTDGVHATMGVYKDVANKVRARSGAGVKLGPANARPGAPASKDKGSSGNPPSVGQSYPLKVGPPFKREDAPAVKEMQKRLKDLGYDIGNTGVDGKFGPLTQAALAAFQSDYYDIDGDGEEFTEKEYQTMNRIADGRVKRVKPSRPEPEIIDTKGKLQKLDPSASNAVARRSAEKFLGRDIEAEEWDMLLRATFAEASPNTKEQGYVMAVILNRARSGRYGGKGIDDVLKAKNQFQAVTGTSADGNRPSQNYLNGPSGRSLNSILTAAVNVLPSAPKDIYRFTSNNPAAYGPGTNIGYLRQLRNEPRAQVIGGTIFA